VQEEEPTVKKSITVGMDIGDKKTAICVVDSEGQKLREAEIATTEAGLRKFISGYNGYAVTVAMETGTHSPWVSRLLGCEGWEVLVGDARKLRMIWKSDRKSDRRDAEMLARVARFDRKILSPIQHRNGQAQADLALIKARDMLVRMRCGLVNHVRGTVKTLGGRIPSCSTEAFSRRAEEHIPGNLRAAVMPLLEEISRLGEQIKRYDKRITSLGEERYPETGLLRQVGGVGSLTALAYVLTLEDPDRFKKSRTVGAFLGMTPRRDQSGVTDKQLRITKAGNGYMRRLLVGCAHYILGPFGPDSDLRRHGLKLMARGGKNAKKRAVVAVARKLSVLLHRLWKTGGLYDPLYNADRAHVTKAA
jgi:transposase